MTTGGYLLVFFQNFYTSLMNFPLTAYIEAALELACYVKLEDGSFSGEIPKLKAVLAFGKFTARMRNRTALNFGGLNFGRLEAGTQTAGSRWN